MSIHCAGNWPINGHQETLKNNTQLFRFHMLLRSLLDNCAPSFWHRITRKTEKSITRLLGTNLIGHFPHLHLKFVHNCRECVVALYIVSSLKLVRVKLGIKVSSVEMIWCRINNFPPHACCLQKPQLGWVDSTTSDDLHVFRAIRHEANTWGECLIVGDFNVEWANRTCQTSDGFDEDLLITTEEEFLHQSITRMGTFCLAYSLIQSQQSDDWHNWEIVATLYFLHNSRAHTSKG